MTLIPTTLLLSFCHTLHFKRIQWMLLDGCYRMKPSPTSKGFSLALGTLADIGSRGWDIGKAYLNLPATITNIFKKCRFLAWIVKVWVIAKNKIKSLTFDTSSATLPCNISIKVIRLFYLTYTKPVNTVFITHFYWALKLETMCAAPLPACESRKQNGFLELASCRNKRLKNYKMFCLAVIFGLEVIAKTDSKRLAYNFSLQQLEQGTLNTIV